MEPNVRSSGFISRNWPRLGSWISFGCLAGLFLAQPKLAASDQEDRQYRENRDQWMRSEESPLALAGLFWLNSGKTSLGTDASNPVLLPAGSAPPLVGVLELQANRVRFLADPVAIVLLNGKRILAHDMQSDADGSTPDVLSVGEIRMKIIQRGNRIGLRVSFLKNPALLAYQGLAFYPIRPAFRVEGAFTPYQPVKKIPIANILGQVEELECPGVVEFIWQGKKLRLEPVLESPNDNKLFFMFKDETNGKETYEGGRYLYSELPRAGKVLLDFNQVHNPYCAYTAFSTCLIPPRQNWLKISIPAGEKKYLHRKRTSKAGVEAAN
ncbi:MAG: DUF1684 domain-containing protein [Terriglobia bacterium]